MFLVIFRIRQKSNGHENTMNKPQKLKYFEAKEDSRDATNSPKVAIGRASCGVPSSSHDVRNLPRPWDMGTGTHQLFHVPIWSCPQRIPQSSIFVGFFHEINPPFYGDSADSP